MLEVREKGHLGARASRYCRARGAVHALRAHASAPHDTRGPVPARGVIVDRTKAQSGLAWGGVELVKLEAFPDFGRVLGAGPTAKIKSGAIHGP